MTKPRIDRIGPIAFGIDPGADGAITLVGARGELMRQSVLSSNPKEVLDTVERITRSTFRVVAFLEDVHAMPGQGVTSMFSFGKSFGYVHMALLASGVEVRLVTPQAWARKVHRAKGQTPKIRSLQTAAMLWPNCSFRASARSKKPHAGLIDSALIAEYGRRILAAESLEGF